MPISLRTVPTLVVAVLAVLATAVAAPAQAARSCGTIMRVGETGTESVLVSAKGVSCRIARRVMRDQAAARADGWECHSAGSEARCTRGAADVSYGSQGAVLPGVRLPDCGISSYGGRVRPAKWDRGCTGVWDLTQMTWRTWGHARASGRGMTQLNDCVPYCALGAVEEFPVRARLSRARRCQGKDGRIGRYYTRIKLIYTIPADNPYGVRGGLRNPTLKLGCVPLTSKPRWRECGRIAFAPNSDDGVFNIRSKQVRCRKARRLAQAAEPTSVVHGPFRYRSRGFLCRGRPEASGLPSVQWICKRKKSRVTFNMS